VQSTGGSGQSSAARANAARSTPEVEARRMRDEHASTQQPAELGQHRLGRRRGVDHRLRDSR
jgi:hypothetical protein